MSSLEKLKELAEDAYVRVDRGYIGVETYTVQGKGRRLSLTRFTEDKAIQEAVERLEGRLPMLGELV